MVTFPDIELSFIINGFIQISNPKPNEFTATVLLIGQLLFTGTQDLNSLTALASQAAGSVQEFGTASAEFQSQVDLIIDRLFSYSVDPVTGEQGWKLEWLGVED